MQADDVDTSVGLYFMTPDRVRAVRPSHTINQLSLVVYLRCRAGLVTDGQGHLGALAHTLWRSGLAGLLVAAAVVTVAAQAALVRCGAVREVPSKTPEELLRACRGSLTLRFRGQVTRGDGWALALAKSALRAWAVLCEVSVPKLSGTSPAVMAAARCVAGAWLLLTLNVNVVLKGLLTAETSHVRPPPIRSLGELLRLAPDTVFGYSSPIIKPAVQDAGIYNMFLCEDNTCEDRFNNDSNRNFAMLQTNYMQSHLKCPRGCHYILRDKIFSFFTVMYSRKALGGLFDSTIQRLHSSGLISAWLRQDKRRRERRPPERRTGTNSAPRDAFLVLAAGLAAAGVAFAVEWARPEAQPRPRPLPRGQGRRASVRPLSGYGYTLHYR
ncbi:hypothetical protein ONE63_002541 [Megalurothrips usitatus]|nr:hypothetical protein ONE63_002541 [Megalurothrips usitatus]